MSKRRVFVEVADDIETLGHVVVWFVNDRGDAYALDVNTAKVQPSAFRVEELENISVFREV